MEFGIKWNCTSILYRVSTDDRISDAYLGQEHIGQANLWQPNRMSLIKDICIGTAAFVVACVLTLSSSIDGYQIYW